MKFTTIWSLPGLPLYERIDRTLDLWSMNLADYLPKRAVYWIAMRQIDRATMTSQNVPATSLDNVLDNLHRIRHGKELVQFKWDESMLNNKKDQTESPSIHPSQLPIPEETI